MIKNNQNEANSPVTRKVIKFDQLEEAKHKVFKDNIQKLSGLLRTSGLNIMNCILAVHDKDAASIYNIMDNRNLACVTVFFKDAPENEDSAKKYYDMKLKEAQAFIMSRKYKILATKIITGGDYPVGKIIVDMK